MAKVPLKLRLPVARIVRPLDSFPPKKGGRPKAPASALVPLDEKCEIHFKIPVEAIEKKLRDPRTRIDPNDIQFNVSRNVTLLQMVVPLEDVRPKK